MSAFALMRKSSKEFPENELKLDSRWSSCRD